MAYWGSDIDENDFAFGAIGATILYIKKQMLKNIDVVKAKNYPEQSIAANLACLRLLGERFPKNLLVHFGDSDLEEVRVEFYQWVEDAKGIPQDRKDRIVEATEREFQLFEERILNDI